MGKRRVAGLLVLTMGLLLGICNTVMPTAFGFMAMCGIILVIGISIWEREGNVFSPSLSQEFKMNLLIIKPKMSIYGATDF